MTSTIAASDEHQCQRCLTVGVQRLAMTSDQKKTHIDDHFMLERTISANRPLRIDVLRTCFPKFLQNQSDSPHEDLMNCPNEIEQLATAVEMGYLIAKTQLRINNLPPPTALQDAEDSASKASHWNSRQFEQDLCGRCLLNGVTRAATTAEQKLGHIDDHITLECKLQAYPKLTTRAQITRDCFPAFHDAADTNTDPVKSGESIRSKISARILATIQTSQHQSQSAIECKQTPLPATSPMSGADIHTTPDLILSNENFTGDFHRAFGRKQTQRTISGVKLLQVNSQTSDMSTNSLSTVVNGKSLENVRKSLGPKPASSEYSIEKTVLEKRQINGTLRATSLSTLVSVNSVEEYRKAFGRIQILNSGSSIKEALSVNASSRRPTTTTSLPTAKPGGNSLRNPAPATSTGSLNSTEDCHRSVTKFLPVFARISEPITTTSLPASTQLTDGNSLEDCRNAFLKYFDNPSPSTEDKTNTAKDVLPIMSLRRPRKLRRVVRETRINASIDGASQSKRIKRNALVKDRYGRLTRSDVLISYDPPMIRQMAVCDECGQQMTNIIAHIATHRPKTIPCSYPQCTYKGNSIQAMKSHTITMHEIRNYTCDQCNRDFALSRDLQVHVTKSHQQGQRVRNLVCDQCGTCFYSIHNLGLHQANHQDLRPYQCRDCGQRYRFAQTLTNHKTKHLLERNFKCDDCDNSFKDRKSLTCHVTIHTGERSFECAVCERAFRVRVMLRNHKLRFKH